MKKLMSFTVFLSAVALGGCSTPFTCVTAPCNNGSGKTVQECANTNGSVTYNFGGTSCNCTSAGCTSCAQQISNFCGGGNFFGDMAGGGGGGGMSGSDMAHKSNCTVTLSGAVSGTFNCNLAILYSASHNLGSITVAVSGATGFQQISLTAQRPGVPMSGTWTENDSGAQAVMVVQQSSSTVPPTWMCSIGNGSSMGSYSEPVTITGCSGSGDQICAGNGTLTATLPATTGTGSSGTVTATATFSTL